MLACTAALLASLCPPAHPAPVDALLVGWPAPPIAPRSWAHEPAPTERETRREARGGGLTRGPGTLGGGSPRAGEDLAELHGLVVLVHALDWEGDGIPELVVDLASANVDRGLVVRSIAPEHDEDDALQRMQRWGADWPVGLVGEEDAGIWARWALASPGDVALVGRGGELAWIGLLDDEKDLLKTVGELLARPTVPALPAPSHAELGRALERYWQGELSRAAALAESAARGAQDEALVEAAQALIDAVAEAEASWPRELGEARRASHELRYLRLLAAIEEAFPRGAAATAAEEIDEEARRDTFFPGRLHDGENYLELLVDRPILFPARADSRGDAFARKLEKLLQATSNDIPATQAARGLLDRYREAR